MSAEDFGVAGPFVGRDGDLDRLVRLASRHRLITLTGPGGVGKTRLARAAAARMLDGTQRSRGYFCALAEVEDPAAVRHAVAARLGIAHAGDPLRSSLPLPPDGQGVIVVIDNCEHVVGAAAAVAEDLLGAGPHVTVLATSRETLRLEGEKTFQVRPLGVPASPDDPRSADSPAVQLFAERARAVRDDFELDHTTLPSVAEICRALDGLPLALEIAAARVRSMGVSDIAGRLGTRFSLLRSGVRGAADRHRSLRAVVDWSYRLLDADERLVFDTLAVFPAGCDLDAAIHTGTAAGLGPGDVMEAIDGLVTKSLLQLDASAQPPRYRMLETLRAYGVERLHNAGRLESARHRHADFYAALYEHLRESGLRVWSPALTRVFVEFDNVRAAVRWALTVDDAADRTFRLLAPLWYVGLQQSSTEIADLCDRALDRWPEPVHPLHSEVLATAATALISGEDLAQARRRAEAAIHGATSPVGVALGWRALAKVSALEGESVTGLHQLDQADRAAVDARFEPLRCDLLDLKVLMLVQVGRRDEALDRARDALTISATQQNAYNHALTLMLIGSLLVDTEPAEAASYLTTALEEARAISYPFGTMFATRALGVLAAAGGRIDEAAGLLLEALDQFVRAGMRLERWTTVAAALPVLVGAQRRDVATVAAAHLTGLDRAITRISAPGWEPVRDTLLAAASDDIIARGRALGADRIIALVRQELRELASPARVPTTVAPPAPVPTAELRRVGSLWSATFGGATVHLPPLRGIEDLALLLENPGREVPALDLAAGAGHEPRRLGAPAEPAADAVGSPGDLGEQVDAVARAAYAKRIRELQAELDDADAAGDAERGARVGQELDTLTQHLAAAYGLHGARRSGDPAERARAAVTGRLRAAVRKIRAVHEPLGRHLDRSLRTGRFCSYVPDDPVTWHVQRR